MTDFLHRIGASSIPVGSELTNAAETPAQPQSPSGGLADSQGTIETTNQNEFQKIWHTSSQTVNLRAELDQQLLSSQSAPGKVSWDSILAIKEELSKDNPDWQKVFQSLQNLSPADRAATLEEMGKDGDLSAGSPFFSMIRNLPPEAHQALADLLTPVVRAGIMASEGGTKPVGFSDALIPIFKAMDDGTGKFADTIRDMYSGGGLPEFSFEESGILVRILNQDPAPEHRLFDLSLMKIMESNSPASMEAYEQFAGAPDPDQEAFAYLKNFANGSQTIPPPGLSEYFQNFPTFALEQLRNINSGGRMDGFVNQLLQSGDNIGKPLAEAMCNYYPFSGYSHDFQSFFQALLAHKDNPMADDIARDMVNTVDGTKGTFVTGLSSLSPAALIDLKMILEAGDDTDLDAQALNLVNDAYKTATSE